MTPTDDQDQAAAELSDPCPVCGVPEGQPHVIRVHAGPDGGLPVDYSRPVDLPPG
jgi:hypothetical protein